MIDKSATEIKAIQDVFRVPVLICYFHTLQAWQRWMRVKDNGVSGMRCNSCLLISINLPRRSSTRGTRHYPRHCARQKRACLRQIRGHVMRKTVAAVCVLM
jgi:hypothetical protein